MIKIPYIINERRRELYEIIGKMVEKKVIADGDLNFILFYFCKYHVKLSYNSIKNFCGELRQCATEIERKILGPYEEKKESENGSI